MFEDRARLATNARLALAALLVVQIGIGFIVVGALRLVRADRNRREIRIAILATTILAVFGAMLMPVNFDIANGSPHAWVIPKDGFHESVDLDSLLPFMQLILLAVSARLLWLECSPRRLREPNASAAAATPVDAS